MSRLESIFRKMSGQKARIMESVNYDKINESDSVKTPAIKKVICRSIDSYRDIVNTDVDVQMEIDLDVHASLIDGGLKYESIENGSIGNLITVSVIGGGSLGAAKISLKKKKITIQIENGITDKEAIILAIQADERVSSLINVNLDSGLLADAASTMDRTPLKGGK